jgi:hypothetical protein
MLANERQQKAFKLPFDLIKPPSFEVSDCLHIDKTIVKNFASTSIYLIYSMQMTKSCLIVFK